MQLWEILLIIGIVAFVLIVFGIRIARKVKGKPLDECACCQKGAQKFVKEYHKKYGKKSSSCCCGK